MEIPINLSVTLITAGAAINRRFTNLRTASPNTDLYRFGEAVNTLQESQPLEAIRKVSRSELRTV